MKQSQIVHRFFLPADQNPPEAIHPAMSAFHHPSPGFESCAALDGLSLFSASADMRRISKLVYQVPHVIVIITFVQAQTMWRTLRRLWSWNWNAFQSFFHHPHVVAVGSINSQTDGNAGGFTQQASLHAALGSVCRIWPGFFPRPAGLWSWLRPSTAMTSSTLSVHRNPQALSSITFEKCRLWSRFETVSERLNFCRFPSHLMRSTGSPSVAQKRSRSSLCGHQPEAARPQTDVCSYASEAGVQSSPTICLKQNTEFSPWMVMNLLAFGITRLFISYIHTGLFG